MGGAWHRRANVVRGVVCTPNERTDEKQSKSGVFFVFFIINISSNTVRNCVTNDRIKDYSHGHEFRVNRGLFRQRVSSIIRTS